jgi:2-keto-3-deoxy-galactonokinase
MLQRGGLQTLSTGNDCERIFEASLYLHYMWASPLYVVIVVGLVTAEIGWAALVGFGLLVVVIPIQASDDGF